MTDNIIETIRARHAAAASKANKLRAQLDAVERELEQYATTLKVVGEIQAAVSQQSTSIGASATLIRIDTDGPSMPDLIVRALEAGPKPIADVTAAVSAISQRAIDANNIRSTAWRMWKAGRISKTGDDYHLNDYSPHQQVERLDDLLG